MTISVRSGTNVMIKKLVSIHAYIKNREFYTYNEDVVRIKTIEDDGSSTHESNLASVTESYIREVTPKMILPGVGLPEDVEERAYDAQFKQERLIKRQITCFDAQANPVSISVYDANHGIVFEEAMHYNSCGQLIEKSTIVTLNSNPSAAAFDHEFMSPNYERKLKEHIPNYIETNEKML